MAARGSCEILPIQIDQALTHLQYLASTKCFIYSRLKDEAAPECNLAGFQLGRADLVAGCTE